MNIRDRIKELRRVPASELRPSPRNWRTHPQAQQDALRGVLAEVGIADAAIARELPDGTLELIDGHLRADVLGDELIPVLVLDVTADEAAKILVTLDPLAAMAEADSDKLDALLREVQTESEALAGMLTELAEDAGILTGPTEVTEDEVPEPPVDPITQCGDLWIMGEHRLLCGDSTKAEDAARVMGGAKINVAFTSPPYASQRKYDESSGFVPIPPGEYVAWWEPIQANVREYLAADGSFFVNIKPACEGLERFLYVFDLVLAMKRSWGWLFAEEFCWERSGIPQQVVRRFKNQFEPIYHFVAGDWKFRPLSVRHPCDKVPTPMGKGAGDTNAARRQGTMGAVAPNDTAPGLAYPGNRLPTFVTNKEACGHAAAFPVGLPSFFIRAYSDEGNSVFDPFLGSGTTLIAAEQLSRRCFGIEISCQYVDVCVMRWEKLTGKKATLDKPATPKRTKKKQAAPA
jgi:site-specific DNA-methyltransferase (adenine-specific)/site-specific DNA-methyltransferase (cytosine-N4-specific)